MGNAEVILAWLAPGFRFQVRHWAVPKGGEECQNEVWRYRRKTRGLKPPLIVGGLFSGLEGRCSLRKSKSRVFLVCESVPSTKQIPQLRSHRVQLRGFFARLRMTSFFWRTTGFVRRKD